MPAALAIAISRATLTVIRVRPEPIPRRSMRADLTQRRSEVRSRDWHWTSLVAHAVWNGTTAVLATIGPLVLIQGFYDLMTHDHARVATSRVEGERDFARRLEAALVAWLDCAADYHEFAAQFFRTAADPDSSLSPFSNESHPARATSVALFRDILTGSDLAPKLDAELAELLPDLLWLHLMVVVLYWVFDRTPDTTRTREFVRRSTPFVARIIALSRYRAFRPLVRDAKSLIADFILPTIGRTPLPTGKPTP